MCIYIYIYIYIVMGWGSAESHSPGALQGPDYYHPSIGRCGGGVRIRQSDSDLNKRGNLSRGSKMGTTAVHCHCASASGVEPGLYLRHQREDARSELSTTEDLVFKLK